MPERQGQNLALAVLYVPHSLDSGTLAAPLVAAGPGRAGAGEERQEGGREINLFEIDEVYTRWRATLLSNVNLHQATNFRDDSKEQMAPTWVKFWVKF